MQKFHCQCGQPIFFDSEQCLMCGARLGFDPESMVMLSLRGYGNRWLSSNGRGFLICDNGKRYGVCNWLVPEEQANPLCRGCRFNRTIPNQSLPGNQQRWHRLEEGKKRLLYTLMQLQLPLENGWDAPDTGLLLDFLEDKRSTEFYPETFVHTGYLGGVITINTLEADDAEREAQRLQLNETYRTVLGHLRHESGHYYWQRLDPDPETRAAFEEVFGPEHNDYEATLEKYYAEGPQPGWQNYYISAYASAHPTEDWAESWGHYLHIYDALETAAAHGIVQQWPSDLDIGERIHLWRGLSVTLNELNRSVGRGDAYPFVLNSEVVKKLVFVDRIIRVLQTRHPATAAR